MIDVVSGEISPLEWKKGTTNQLKALPVSDSVLAIADSSYFDWKILPEAPSGLAARELCATIALTWELHGGDPARVAVERRTGNSGAWQRIATETAGTAFTDVHPPSGSVVCYRVRALNGGGESPFSNIVRVER